MYCDQFRVESGVGEVACDDGEVIVTCVDLGDDVFEVGFADSAWRDMDIR